MTTSNPKRGRALFVTPSSRLSWLLAALPFILLLTLYLTASHQRLEVNPADKILPSIEQMIGAVQRMAFEPDRRSGDYLLWTDTGSSLRRLGMGMLLCAVTGLSLGVGIGLFPLARGLLRPIVTFVSMIPPLAILPILFISFGVGELGKVMLIFFGITPIIARDVALAVEKIPRQHTVKALTLGGGSRHVLLRVVLPQVMPRLFEAVRLTLGAGWLFLIAAEAIAATDGLGYRIFLVRRYLAMDVIIPYVLWITLIGFTVDWILRRWVRWRYRWYSGSSG